MIIPVHLLSDAEIAMRHLRREANPVWHQAAAAMLRQEAEKLEAFLKLPASEQVRLATPAKSKKP